MPESPRLPLHEGEGVRLWLHPELRGEDPAAWLARGEPLLEERAAVAGGRVLGEGRGAARAVQLGARAGVWRVNHHGGLLGGVQGKRYRSTRRLESEIALSGWLRERRVATPEVLLGLGVRRGLFWRQHLVTEEVAGARTVFAAREDPAALAAADALLERLFDLGLWATDLHPANLLWQADPAAADGGVCWLIDLAGASLRPRPLDPGERQARRARFARYFAKHAGAVPPRFAEA